MAELGPDLWPPPEHELIGEARARRILVWLREHARPVIAQAKQEMAQTYGVPVEAVQHNAPTLEWLARMGLDNPQMPGLAIAAIWAERSGSFTIWRLVILRDGTLAVRR